MGNRLTCGLGGRGHWLDRLGGGEGEGQRSQVTVAARSAAAGRRSAGQSASRILLLLRGERAFFELGVQFTELGWTMICAETKVFPVEALREFCTRVFLHFGCGLIR